MRRPGLSLIVAAALAGCGGSDSDDGAPREPARPATEGRAAEDDFVRRLDALCREANPELASIQNALTKTRDASRAGRVGLPQTFEAFAALLGRASAITQRLEARLRRIDAPPAERSFRRSLLDSVEKGASNLRQQVSAAKAQDAVRLRDLSVRGSLVTSEQKGLIRGHGGFRSCGRR